MQAIKTLALLAAASLCAAGVDLAAAQTKAPPKTSEFLFVQTAKNVAFKDGVLTLQDVSPVTAFFSDRPQRIVGPGSQRSLFEAVGRGQEQFQE
jgi:hypothetical protein